MAAANLERDIFCVSLICLLPPPPVQDASLDAALFGFHKWWFQIGEEDSWKMAFSSRSDLCPCYRTITGKLIIGPWNSIG